MFVIVEHWNTLVDMRHVYVSQVSFLSFILFNGRHETIWNPVFNMGPVNISLSLFDARHEIPVKSCI